jgi:D-sedoheptulose 7-phosphate isomerase
MDFDKSLACVVQALEDGAELRLRVARECGPRIVEAAQAVASCLQNGGKALFFGNGGSAADAQHIAAELVGRYYLNRKALPALALTTDTSILTAVGNDFGFDQVYVRQVEALGRSGDVAFGISTSGNSPSVILAMEQASRQGMVTIGLSGATGGKLCGCAEIPILVPAKDTARIQECHITIGHLICELVERELAGRSELEDGKT